MSIEKAVTFVLSEWTKGYEDCERGLAHKEGKCEEYDRGYSDCYQTQAIEGAEGA